MRSLAAVRAAEPVAEGTGDAGGVDVAGGLAGAAGVDEAGRLVGDAVAV